MSDSSAQVDSFLRLGADGVYILLHHGWPKEVRSNRWHFATRWARHLPVVLVMPETLWPSGVRLEEPRIPNARILKVAPNGGALGSAPASIQLFQIEQDMQRAGIKRPVLWLYNANFAEVFSVVPNAIRVHHITENYFDFPNMSPLYLERVRFVSRGADLNIAVSDGCARPLRNFVKEDSLMIATNGCDFSLYGAPGLSDKTVLEYRKLFKRIAVFAGNINDRIDLDLVEALSERFPETLLLFIGPQKLSAGAATRLHTLKAHHQNILTRPEVAAECLPAIYRTADLGFIPYVQERWIVENGFPLKVLEMAATGLPVVTTSMRPLLTICPPIEVTEDRQDFIAAFSAARRTPEAEQTLRRVAEANDYTIRFQQILDRLAHTPRNGFFEKSGDVESIVRSKERVGILRRYALVLRYRISAPLSLLVDRLPSPFARILKGLKRSMIGRHT